MSEETKPSSCDCEYCQYSKPCLTCGHKIDDHMCGDGGCFLCLCPKFTEEVDVAWDALSPELRSQTTFANFAASFERKES